METMNYSRPQVRPLRNHPEGSGFENDQDEYRTGHRIMEGGGVGRRWLLIQRVGNFIKRMHTTLPFYVTRLQDVIIFQQWKWSQRFNY